MIPDEPTAIPYPRAAWRLIVHGATDGPANMAVDEAITEQVRDGQALPTLRFYAWEPACLSLGYAQPASDVDLERLRARGWDVVRRLSGGRAILHVDELTYSVAVPAADARVAGGVVESYRRLSQGLLAGLEKLGAAVHAAQAGDEAHGFKGPVCFEVPSDYEITVQGRKLIGSAQTRRAEGGVVLQHGALPLTGDLGRICEALAFADEAAQAEARARVLQRAITLEEALGRVVSFGQVAEAMAAGFAQALNLELREEPLGAEERARAAALRAGKYASDEWTHRH